MHLLTSYIPNFLEETQICICILHNPSVLKYSRLGRFSPKDGKTLQFYIFSIMAFDDLMAIGGIRLQQLK